MEDHATIWRTLKSPLTNNTINLLCCVIEKCFGVNSIFNINIANAELKWLWLCTRAAICMYNCKCEHYLSQRAKSILESYLCSAITMSTQYASNDQAIHHGSGAWHMEAQNGPACHKRLGSLTCPIRDLHKRQFLIKLIFHCSVNSNSNSKMKCEICASFIKDWKN